MNNLKTFEEYSNIPTENLRKLNLHKVNVGGRMVALPSGHSKKFNINVEKGKIKILSDEFNPFELYDFVVLEDGTLLIGLSHYKLAKKAESVKAAGELKVNEEGKIIYINNESGHYRPTKNDLQNIISIFKEMEVTAQELQVQPRY
jgi:hypothetical protein